MEISWKWLSLCFGLLFARFCHGFPVNSEDISTGHAQFLTGIAAILVTIGSIVLAGCLCCKRRKGFQEFHNSPVVASVAPNLEHGHINPIANSEFTIFTPLSPPHFNNNVFLANEQIIRRTSDDYVYGDIDISPWFVEGSEKDFPRIKLKYIKELGKGRFGKVVEGAAQYLDPDRTWTPVVVRILDAAANARERILFLNDALFYLAPAHANVLAIKGRCLGAAPLLLLQESCSGGDLKSRLRDGSDGEDRTLRWCCQLTSALRHLHDNDFIHPDLASRNCLLTDSLTLKLGDYSLSAAKYPEDYYKGGEPLISVRWRSPESLDCTPTTIQPKTLTKEANVWSLGVVIWEICENGSQPYGSLDDDEVISRVFGPECLRLSGPSKPQLYSDYISRLIKMCWNNAESRPKVTQIDMMLSDLLQVHKNTQDPLLNVNDDFNRRWESFKPNTIVKTDNRDVSIDMEGDEDQSISKPMSPSLNNLHGSLDNLFCAVPNVLSDLTDDRKDGLDSAATKPDVTLKSNIDFKLGPSQLTPNEKSIDSPNHQNDSLTDSMIFKQGSSESDTEEENWRRKVERGAYSEKVRLKSRSVADLMVLTHVDYSESESETPLPSIDYKSNRTFRKSNLENSSLNFSSEGNLLSIEHTFEKELKKLRVERRDSLLFVPDNKSQNNSNLSLLHELNSPTEIKPMNQIYNIFNMTIDKFDSMRVSGSKLNDLINMGDETRIFSRQDSENKSDLGYATLHNSERNSDFGSVDGEHLLEDRSAIIKTEIEERLKNCEFSTKARLPGDGMLQQTKQNLPDILASLDQEHGQVNVDLLESNLTQTKMKKADNDSLDLPHVDCNDQNTLIPNNTSDIESHQPLGTTIPKLSKIILNNHKLMQFVGDLSKESQVVPDLCSENIQSSDLIYKKNELKTYTESLLPEIKQSFVKGLNILESLNSPEGKSKCEAPKIIKISNLLKTVKSEPEEGTSFSELNMFLDAERSEALADVSREENHSDSKIAFDLSEKQQKTMPNPLTHTAVFSSTPFGKKQDVSLPTENAYSSLNLFATQHDNSKDDELLFSNFLPLEPNDLDNESRKLDYSLETWDNFLGKSFDSNRESNENLFDSFTSEPQSMLFLEEDCQKAVNDRKKPQSECRPEESSVAEPRNDGTFTLEEKGDGTFVVEDKGDGSYAEENPSGGYWESGGGWFLHPQSNALSGDIEPQPSTSKGSYIGFGVDDEIMTAIRNELLEKLPHAQGASHENVKEDEEWNQSERNEVFIRYNVYNTPLSPIPEESSFDENDEELVITGETTPKLNYTDSDWSDRCELEYQPALSSHTNDSPLGLGNQEHTPSQSSCCSNDTLFNFEDFTSTNDKENAAEQDQNDDVFERDVTDDQREEAESANNNDKPDDCVNDINTQPDPSLPPSTDQLFLEDFLTSERNHTSSSVCTSLPFTTKMVAPLPSPEDKPWKSLPASLLSYKTVQKSSLTIDNTDNVPKSNECCLLEPDAGSNKVDSEGTLAPPSEIESIDNSAKNYANLLENPSSYDANRENDENLDVQNGCKEIVKYENVLGCSASNEADYVNIGSLEAKAHDHVNSIEHDTPSITDHHGDIFGVLTDIRFSGPIDSQLMSTSFSESNDVDEQDWDSGSDTRSSSSGEFIWKEGEHEESLKALRAAPHDVLEDLKPMEEITEETSESDISTSTSDDEAENLEFVPSAWDKFATPTKSALRSPEKSLDRSESKKPKGVWFKKQKYHCVYEYPREPESPVLQSQDLWKPQIDYAAFSDWEFDAESYLPPPTAESDLNPSTFTYKPKTNHNRRSLYYLTSPNEIQGDGSSTSSNTDEESNLPLNTNADVCSQFFPGASSWIENVTPDSGLDDFTPGSITDATELRESYADSRQVLPLKKLAAQVIDKTKHTNKGPRDVLGGLRHTRNKLKLDLPPSPSAFTSNKTFTVEPLQEPVVLREKPTFSTFGKSRFLVQHVDTPTDNSQPSKNVCFDVLPYKPINIIPLSNVECQENNVTYEPLKRNVDDLSGFSNKKDMFVKGEASLLDSADEDSGIESSTLERKINNLVCKENMWLE